MKRKYFSALLMGALTIAATSTVTSCKDYDDDIQNLQQQIDANKSTLEKISELIKSGSVITNVEKAASGVTVKLSNGDTFTINNGKDGEKGADGVNGQPGTPGTAWTISEDGYWVKDGVKTSYKALGEKGKDGINWTIGEDGYWYKDGEKTSYKAIGEDGKDNTGGTAQPGKDGANGKYYVPNEKSGCFDIYQDGKLLESTTISYLSNTIVSGGITAVKNDISKTLTLFGVEGGEGENNKVVISLSGDLTSLVFMPEIYMDGIETIEYKWLNGKLQTPDTNFPTFKNRTSQNKQVKWDKKELDKDADVYDYKFNDKTFVYGPAWPVKYHANPVNANVEENDLNGFNVLNPTAYYTEPHTTRAAVEALGKVSSPAKAFGTAEGNGLSLFKMGNDGVLQVGLQIEKPDALEPHPTKKIKNDVNTVALQVKNDEGNNIVSDYALVTPTKLNTCGMIWYKAPTYAADKDANGNAKTQTGDEKCPVTNIKNHVWDTAKEALQDNRGAALELYWDSQAGINLADYVGVCLAFDTDNELKQEKDYLYLTPEEAKQYGLTFHYKRMMYTLDTNVTSESKYLKKINAEDDTDGQFRAWNVKWDANPQDESATAAVDREPLVQVYVTNNKGEVVMDGYILIHITKQADKNLVVDKWTGQNAEFDQCDVTPVFQTTWSEFNDYILTTKEYFDEKMTKELFDYQYEPDLVSNTNFGTTDDPLYLMKIFDSAPEKGDAIAENNNTSLGHVLYRGNTNGSTNHTWRWEIDEDQMEDLLHHETSVTKTRYVRFKATKSNAKYPYIYVKMTTTITRKVNSANKFGTKDPDYWFAKDGNDDGFYGIVFNAHRPTDNGNIKTINRTITSTLEGNTENTFAAGKAHKYYFEPKEIKIKAQSNTEYTITPVGKVASYKTINRAIPSATDVATVAKTIDQSKGDKLICKYNYVNGTSSKCGDFSENPARVGEQHKVPTNDEHAWNTFAETVKTCAVDYNKGAFANEYLFAKHGASIEPIAYMNPTTGEINLIHTKSCEEILNAIGYAPAHANLDTQMRSWVGVVAANGCDVAETVADGEFIVSWERPINIETSAQPAIDAKDNGNYIYATDFLKMYDWRGETAGYAWDDHTWYWGYYNVQKVTIDVTPANVETTLGNQGWRKLSQVSPNELSLYTIDPATGNPSNKGVGEFTFDLRRYAASGAWNNVLKTRMANEGTKSAYGYIFYTNNGDNVEDFDLKVPVTITYEWGEFTTNVTIHVTRSLGN